MRFGSNRWQGAGNWRQRQGGFTFAELLAAMVFMAILIPVVIQGVALANRASVVAERKTVAAQLAENKLNEIVLTRAWESPEKSGDFGEDWPAFRWVLTQSAWREDSMLELTVEVVFEVQGREHRVNLTTLVDETES
jgi:type II secretory pathway pseudopilin PulG